MKSQSQEGTGFQNILKVFLSQLTSFVLSEPPNLLPLNFGQDIMDEGSFAQVSCIVTKGDQPLAISWSFHGSNITSELGITTMPTGPMGSLLMIPSVGHKHRGTYTCKAQNSAGVRSQSVELRVNGKEKTVSQLGIGNSFKRVINIVMLIVTNFLFRASKPAASFIRTRSNGCRSLCTSSLHRNEG